MAILFSKDPQLSVGIVSANIMNVGADIAALERCGVKYAHFDVMDGHFAPPLTVGPAFIAGVKTQMLKDVHLMIANPLPVLPEYAAAGADILTVHVEACPHPHRCLQVIGELKNSNDEKRGIARGIALNPSTPLTAIESLLDCADYICLVAINPGFPNQKFIEATRSRIVRVQAMILESGRDIAVGTDGGITRANMGMVAALSPRIIVTGSAVFANHAIVENIDEMRNSIASAQKDNV